ncbi:aldose epimerase [Phormidium sp. CLA17]|uniref:aldose epimerase family protein n=1 Tax=Leptolyngbya sp. Cla-17 TaxID=2803751 RepID=UPI0014921829|nr:aldose epimerase [Leptolyngbya sp. Cla-17]MBM0742257.1 aldose epimerase [Leptolyngbya sp. Cla-17]
MSAIATEQRQYLTYILTDEATGTTLEIVPERGGIATSWQMNGQEIFYLDKERFTDPTLTVRGGNPILFPLCGNVVDNTYTHNGKDYSIKQHGFARELPWSVVKQSTDDGASLTLGLTSTEQTRTAYPFEFELAFTYILKGDTLTLSQRFTNHSAEPMPFSVGFHPYFAVTDKTALQFQIPSSEFYDQRAKLSQAYTGNFDFELDEIDVAFTELSSHVATVTDPNKNLKLTFTFSPDFSTVVFWTVKGKDFYCLEPWTAGRNALNTGDRLIHLAPGATLEAEFAVKAESLG